MVYERINPISDRHQTTLTAIGKKILELRRSTGLSIERFCVRNDLPEFHMQILKLVKTFI